MAALQIGLSPTSVLCMIRHTSGDGGRLVHTPLRGADRSCAPGRRDGTTRVALRRMNRTTTSPPCVCRVSSGTYRAPRAREVDVWAPPTGADRGGAPPAGAPSRSAGTSGGVGASGRGSGLWSQVGRTRQRSHVTQHATRAHSHTRGRGPCTVLFNALKL